MTTSLSPSSTTTSVTMVTISTNTESASDTRSRDNFSANLHKFSGRKSNNSANQWWTLLIQWCTLHAFSEQQLFGRFVFHLRYFALPPLSKSTLVNLKGAFLVRFGKTRNNFDIDELDIKQQLDERAEEYISRIQQLACD